MPQTMYAPSVTHGQSVQMRGACECVRDIRQFTGRWPSPQAIAEQLDCPLMLAGFALARVKRADNRDRPDNR